MSEFGDEHANIWNLKDYKKFLCNCLSECGLVFAGKITQLFRIFAVISVRAFLIAKLMAKDAFVFCVNHL